MRAQAKPPKNVTVLGDKSVRPKNPDLGRALGPTVSLWNDLVAHINENYPPVREEWNFSGSKFGWTLRLKKGDRIVLYLIPQLGRFLVGIVLGGKAVAAASSAKLPSAVLTAIAEAPKYAEGTGLRLSVTDQRDLPPIKQLAALKMSARST